MLRVGACCLALHDGAYAPAKIVKINKKSAQVAVAGTHHTLPLTSLWLKKKKKHVRKSRGEVLPVKHVGARPARFVPPVLVVEPVWFQGCGRKGDYQYMLTQPNHRTLCIYNENLFQQRNKQSTTAGGGNACARPWRSEGSAIGIPTGQGVGYRSLDEPIHSQVEETAKDTIGEAIDEIVNHVVANPTRFDTIHYSVNREGEELIGMGIFHIGEDVREYITKAIKALPAMIACQARANRRLIRK